MDGRLKEKLKEGLKERLEGLEKEYKEIKQFRYLSFDCMDRCEEWYKHEINCCKERLKEYGNI
jgi:chlorite dismutase